MTWARRLILAALTLWVTASPLLGASAEVRLKVAVVMSRSLSPYDEAARGFTAALTAAGYAPAPRSFNLEGEAAGAADVARRILEDPPDVVLTLGSLATTEISEKVEGIPVVFCMVLEPGASGLVAEGQRGGANLTGVTMDIPPEAQLDAIARVLPRARRIGVLHSAESAATVSRARAAAEARGMSLAAVAVDSEREVPRALTQLFSQADVLLAVPDATVFTEGSTRYILLHTLRQAQPFVGLMESFVSAGALMALGLDFEDLGAQAGEIAAAVARGQAAGSIPVQGPRRTQLLLNLRTARRIGVSVPEAAQEGARVVVP